MKYFGYPPDSNTSGWLIQQPDTKDVGTEESKPRIRDRPRLVLTSSAGITSVAFVMELV